MCYGRVRGRDLGCCRDLQVGESIEIATVVLNPNSELLGGIKA